HDLDFIEVARWEQGANGTVDQARSQDLLGCRPALSLNEAAGKLAGGVGFLPIIHNQRKKVAALICLSFDGGDQCHRIAVAHHDGTMRLLGELSRFNDQILRTEWTFYMTCLHGTSPHTTTVMEPNTDVGGEPRRQPEGKVERKSGVFPSSPVKGFPYLRRPNRLISETYRLRS